ncbi:MAG TPA: DUF1328 domain-containing protein [Planctomycetota bacterium]|nr:DUF1328 domain-containing protein [Planctomycetota bacterium]
MLRWSLAFFIVAIVAALFGFTGISAGAVDIARVLFFFFIVACVVLLLWSLMTGRRIPPPI